jgi:hypothetical protein
VTSRRTLGVAALAGALAAAAPAAPAHAQPVTVHVPCDPQALVSAVKRVNAAGAGTISLARHCTYRFTTRHAGGNALPRITAALTLQGNGAVLKRASDAPRMRIIQATRNSTLTVRDITLVNGDVIGSGGDLLVDGAATLDLEHSHITNGKAVQGGGIYLNSTSSQEHRIVGSVVDHNTGKRRVGPAGIALASGALLIDRTFVAYNTGVGISISSPTSTARITGSLVFRNTRNGILSAGLLTVGDTRVSQNRFGGLSSSGTATLQNSRVTANTGAARGGGVLNYSGGKLTVENTPVLDNSATLYPGVGGGIDNDSAGGGNPTITVRNSPISGNSAFNGGGIANFTGTATLEHTHVTHNVAVYGGGVSTMYGALTLENSLVTNNRARNDGGGVYNRSGTVIRYNSLVHGNAPHNCGGPTRVPGCSGFRVSHYHRHHHE